MNIQGWQRGAGAIVVMVLGLAPAVAQAAQSLRTEVLQPERHHLRVEDLPAPNERESVNQRPDVVKVPANPVLRAPAGFKVNLFAEGVSGARWLVLTPTGDVLVTQKRGNDIVLLRDRDGDGVAEDRRAFASRRNALNLPFGIAFADGHIFIANTDGVRKYAYRDGQDELQGRGEQIHELPGGGYNQHWTRNLVLGPDGRTLFVTVGSESNVDVEPAPRASVMTMNLEGGQSRIFASGLRNPIGLAFHPQTREPYVVVNERDRLGDRLVPDYFTRLQEGGFYGWPFSYLKADLLDPRRTKNGRSERPDLAEKTLTPDVLIEAHAAALGLTFYTGNVFPERYRRGAYAALHGSWNRSQAAGYKLIFFPFTADHRPEGGYEDLVTGFVLDRNKPTVWGRPVGLVELPDGSLLFADDENDRVYRVSYDTSSAGTR